MKHSLKAGTNPTQNERQKQRKQGSPRHKTRSQTAYSESALVEAKARLETVITSLVRSATLRNDCSSCWNTLRLRSFQISHQKKKMMPADSFCYRP
jgi:hypothetical protein